MHTDDVFMGIIVNRTKSLASCGTSLEYLSEFAGGTDLLKALQPKWNRGKSKFFHVPNITIYYTWSLNDLA